MADRPKFFDDLAGVAGGAFSALAGIQQEVEALVRSRIDEALRKLDLDDDELIEGAELGGGPQRCLSRHAAPLRLRERGVAVAEPSRRGAVSYLPRRLRGL